MGAQLFLVHLPLSPFHCSSSLPAHSPFVSSKLLVVFDFAESVLFLLLTPLTLSHLVFSFLFSLLDDGEDGEVIAIVRH